MARVNVDDYAFDDPRFDALAGSLRSLRDRWHALGCCLRIWHLCSSRRTDTVRAMELAHCLKLRKPLSREAQERAMEAFVDIAGLGERVADGIRVRGTKGRTDYLDRMDQARSLPERLVEYVREHECVSRTALRKAFGDTPRSTFYRAVHQLVDDRELVSRGDSLSVPPSVPVGVPWESQGIGETVPGVSRDAVPDLDLVLDPDPALDIAARADRAHAHAHTDAAQIHGFHGSPMGVPRESHGTPSEEARPVATRHADRYAKLYEHWDTTGREMCAGSWRSSGPVAGRHRVCEALNHPELLQRSDAEIIHGLAMLQAECEQRAELGQEDPWRWYRDAWRPRVLSVACEVPDERAARTRASPRKNGTTNSYWMDEINAELEAKERAHAQS